MALEVDEWRQLSDRAIAEMCGVDHKTVASVKEQDAAIEARMAEARLRQALGRAQAEWPPRGIA